MIPLILGTMLAGNPPGPVAYEVLDSPRAVTSTAFYEDGPCTAGIRLAALSATIGVAVLGAVALLLATTLALAALGGWLAWRVDTQRPGGTIPPTPVLIAGVFSGVIALTALVAAAGGGVATAIILVEPEAADRACLSSLKCAPWNWGR